MIAKNKTRVTIAVPADKVKDLKKKAIDAGLSLGEYLVNMGLANYEQVMKLVQKGGGCL